MIKRLYIFFLIVGALPLCQAQDSTTFSQKKLNTVLIASGVGGTGGIIGFNELWYKSLPRSSFHFFDDNNQWLQLDKAGHYYSSFHYSKAGIKILQWTGTKRKKAIWWGGMMGIIAQTPLEIFDGLSKDYGASWGDLVANAVGSFTVIGQYLQWDEIRINTKFSMHLTSYAAKRPNVLGKNVNERLFKDYNGQTYWACFRIHKFLKKESNFPKWLNLAVGYGGEAMVYGTPKENETNGYNAYRQFYLSPDINLEAIKTKSKFLNTCLYLMNHIHLPLPALEISKNSKFYFFYL